MRQLFSVQYRINDETYEIVIQARDWHEAEAILACIKENGKVAGAIQPGSMISPEIAYNEIRPGDSLREH